MADRALAYALACAAGEQGATAAFYACQSLALIDEAALDLEPAEGACLPLRWLTRRPAPGGHASEQFVRLWPHDQAVQRACGGWDNAGEAMLLVTVAMISAVVVTVWSARIQLMF
jgi:hypothetical protein